MLIGYNSLGQFIAEITYIVAFVSGLPSHLHDCSYLHLYIITRILLTIPAFHLMGVALVDWSQCSLRMTSLKRTSFVKYGFSAKPFKGDKRIYYLKGFTFRHLIYKGSTL